MTNNELRPYNEYRNANTEWIGDLPIGWETTKLSAKFFERRTKVSDKDYMPLSVTKKGIVPQLSTAAKSNDGDNRKLVKKGDFVINSRSDRKGSSGLSSLDGSVSLINIVLEPQNIKPEYVHYLFKSKSFIEEYYRNGRGIVADLWTTRFSEMKNIYIPIPSDIEQDKIVKYLDYKLVKVNKFIKAKKKLIAVLKEQKQAIITHAVTKGLDNHCREKFSGYAFLGNIPENWQVQRFTRVAKVKSNLVNPDDYQMYKQVSPENIEKNSGRLFECQTVQEAGVISSNHLFCKGQILYSKVRPKLNKVTIAPFDGLCSADMYPIETNLDTEYLLYYMLSNSFLLQLAVTENRVKMPKINKEELSSVIVVVPPISKQKEIVIYIKDKVNKITETINQIEKEIQLVEEYKISLISTVVTGKIDIRNIKIVDIDLDNIDDLENEDIDEYENDETDEFIDKGGD